MGTLTARRPSEFEGAGIAIDDEFTSSYRASLGRLVGFFRAKGVPREESADLANETMVRMLVHLKRHGRDRTDLGPLVRTIARNLLVERVRKQAPVIVPLADDIDVADDGLGPVDQLVMSERRTEVRKAIGSLSPRHRHVVGLWMDGRTPGEIARELGVKRNAVDAILHRARRSLASKLDGSGVLGVFGITIIRARAFLRRAAGTFVTTDPGGHSAATASGLVAVSLAAVVSFSPAATAVQRPDANAPSVRAVKADATDSSGRLTKAPTTKQVVDRGRNVVERVETRTREFTTSIPTGEHGGVGVTFTEWERNDGRESVLGPILSKVVTDNLCHVAQCAEK
jgi:RNA polymerase sigma factor (sigma-70 family)